MKHISTTAHASLAGMALVILFFVMVSAVVAQDKDWRPVSAEELQMKTPKVEPDADAEAIFWNVRVDDSSAGELSLKHYVRIKIFTERGKDDFSKHNIYFNKGTRIKDVEARVTKPDGSVVMLKKEDVLEREIAKKNGLKVLVKSFAIPSLEIGSILEYQYKEIIEDVAANMRLIFQREVPIETVSYYVKPYSGDRAMLYSSFNVGNTRFVDDKDGFKRVTMTNVPAFHEEPDMLPENEVKSWMYIYYTREPPKTLNDYWSPISKALFEAGRSSMKPNDEITAAAKQAIEGAATDEEKVHKIHAYVKTQIRNITYASNVTDDEKKKAQRSKTAIDTFKLKMGSSNDIDTLFGAMVRSVGFDARVAVSGNRSEMIFNPKVTVASLMMASSCVAVKIGSEWQFFSPAEFHVPYGMLGWVEEDQFALISDPKEPIWKKIPLSPAEASLEKRSGKFRILDDGTLEGEGRIEFTGHLAELQKEQNRKDSQDEREKSLKKLVRSNILGTAEIDSVKMENIDDPEKPVLFTFKIRVPGYGSRTGKRLFFQPNVFERSSKPRFTASTRKYEIYFDYPFSESDDIIIELPNGFTLESPDVPAPIEDPQRIGRHQTLMTLSGDKRTLNYKRTFSFGNGGFIKFPVEAYQPLKTMFEAFNKADVHQLTLRQDAPPPAK